MTDWSAKLDKSIQDLDLTLPMTSGMSTTASLSFTNGRLDANDEPSESRIERFFKPRVNLTLLRETRDVVEMAIRNQMVTDWLSGKYVTADNIASRNRYDGWGQSNWRLLLKKDTGDIIHDDDAPIADADRCDSAMCVAGWAGQIIGDEHEEFGWVLPVEPSRFDVPRDAKLTRVFFNAQYESEEEPGYTIDPGLSEMYARPGEPEAREIMVRVMYEVDGVDHIVPKKVLMTTVENRVTRLLGLTYQERELLFTGDNNLAAVRAAFDVIEQSELARREYHDAKRAQQEQLEQLDRDAQKRTKRRVSGKVNGE